MVGQCNLTDDGTFKYVYDAWNRLVKVKSSNDDSIIIATYSYDALGRRIKKVVENRGELDGTTLYYYNNRWQLLETRDGSESLDMQIVHGTQYIDEIVRFGKVGRGGMFVYQDANWNVTSAVGFSGIVLDRVTTTPYGQPTFDTQTVNGDYDGDGDLDSSDDSQLNTCVIASTVPDTCRMFDYDLDGDVDTADETHFDALYPGSDVITRFFGREKSKNGFPHAKHGLPVDFEGPFVSHWPRIYAIKLRTFIHRDRSSEISRSGNRPIGAGEFTTRYEFANSRPVTTQEQISPPSRPPLSDNGAHRRPPTLPYPVDQLPENPHFPQDSEEPPCFSLFQMSATSRFQGFFCAIR